MIDVTESLFFWLVVIGYFYGIGYATGRLAKENSQNRGV